MKSAFEIAARHSRAVVLLGASPQGPGVEYGWIELGPSAHGSGAVWSRVKGFFEKPSLYAARELFARGFLWNTFVMGGHVRGFLEMANASLADVVELLRGSRLWAGAEVHVHNSLYERIPAIDFFTGGLVGPDSAVARPADGRYWLERSGAPQRVLTHFGAVRWARTSHEC